MLKPLLALPRTVWLLGWVSLLNDAASDLVYPLLPIYLSSVLLAGPKALGLIEGIAETVGSLLKLASGLLADRLARSKPLVVGGYALAAFSRPLIALASVWPVVLALRFMDRVGKGLRSSPRDAMLAASVDSGRRGLAFGLQRGMDNAGAVIGPLAAWLLLEQGLAVRDLIFWTALPGVLTVALAAIVAEPDRPRPSSPRPLDWSPALLPRRFRRYLLVLALFSLGNSSNMFLLLQARAMGLPEAQIPLLWGLTSLTATLFSPVLAGWSDRLGRVRLIGAGWIIYGLFYLGLGTHDNGTAALWPAFAVYGLFLAATEGAEKALVADLAPPELLGTAYGWFHLITGLTLLPASVLFGWLWERFAPLAAFGWASGCAFAAVLLLWLWVGSDGRDQ
ncbi:MAG: MFS transporter [Methylococcaceae bacterium]|nr:MFS transporter [Methylococcaceae bacterium]